MGRESQKRRTRKALVEAAGRLIADGGRPSVAEVADAAEISRRTAYRYFPSAEQLFVEAALEATRQNMELSIDRGPADEPVADRVDRLVDALSRMTLDNEPLLRQMIRHTIDRDPIEPGVPPRPSRRLEYVERTLTPLRGAVDQDELDLLTHALTVVIGIESTIVLRDICGLDSAGILRVQHWAARALVTAVNTARSAPS
ncbi:TetR/AcrR family transcriptional regulator [Amycolatopsis australiensis]|uniref:DNA-binding transcriptional regulator, AcrR family n=1 Tax=Amycolatopsis australiensis TaxID=546364 RepID=A0A1K1SPX3_9PSEU|nr:TetR/AcrR family transcriptional regulator [Amycolatopsis australiensis]SFW86369.1 DNA-binding transcriptional regulator, AcrR family [Amycolatopsis australiensis]